jgi:hypothetical protein
MYCSPGCEADISSFFCRNPGRLALRKGRGPRPGTPSGRWSSTGLRLDTVCLSRDSVVSQSRFAETATAQGIVQVPFCTQPESVPS